MDMTIDIGERIKDITEREREREREKERERERGRVKERERDITRDFKLNIEREAKD